MPEAAEGSGEERAKGTWGAFLISLVACLIFPILALWNGPEYLWKEDYLKGTLLMVIVAVEVTLVYAYLY